MVFTLHDTLPLLSLCQDGISLIHNVFSLKGWVSGTKKLFETPHGSFKHGALDVVSTSTLRFHHNVSCSGILTNSWVILFQISHYDKLDQ